ncbi:hypothetical protein MMC19_002627 [Ptychographa xylographoides]|nr:hypothetical protein [Ptychographa xylographoides]
MSDFSTSALRHRALQSRNTVAAAAFVYAVLTTRIYCRPNCPSRLARRANITFFDNAAEAAAAGFRACKRCVPDVERGGSDLQEEVIERACTEMARRMVDGNGSKLEEAAKSVGWTKSHFCRVFKRVKGITVGEWVRSLDLGRIGAMHKKGSVDVQWRIGTEVVGVSSTASSQGELDSEEDWENWLNYSECSTPLLVSQGLPMFS